MKLHQAQNLVPTWLLRSPLHRIMSGRYALVSFTGRRSGRTITTPVAYVQEGDTVWLSTNSGWWRNLVDKPRVRLRLRGRGVDGEARVIEDESEAVQALRRLVDAIPSYSRPAHLQRTDGRVADEELLRAVRDDRTCISVVLDPRTKEVD